MYIPTPYRGICVCCGISYHSNKFKNNPQRFSIPSTISSILIKYFPEGNNRICTSCKKSLYKLKNTADEIVSDDFNPTNSTSTKMAINEKYTNSEFKENCVDD